MNSMRILFLGNNFNPTSIISLERILAGKSHEVVVLIDSPAGRGFFHSLKKTIRRYGVFPALRKIGNAFARTLRSRLGTVGAPAGSHGSLFGISQANKIRSFFCKDINSQDSVALLKNLGPDVVVVAGFSQILRNQVLGIPRLGCINVHPSLLPRYRGPVPEYWVLKNRECKTGVTVHYLDEGIDTGDIIVQKEVTVQKGESERDLAGRCAEIGSLLLVEVLTLMEAGKAPRIRQDDQNATYYSFPRKAKLLSAQMILPIVHSILTHNAGLLLKYQSSKGRG